MTALSGGPAERQHYWDTLRAVLMLLGIPYHVALSYVPGHQWIVRSDEGVAGFDVLADFIHLFRMPAFFLIAGYFAAMLLRRREPRRWLKGRLLRLVPPFVATILILVPLMNLACEFSNLSFAAALPSFVGNSLNSGGYWVRHLWFIIVLLYLSMALTTVFLSWPNLRSATLPARLDAFLARRFVLALLAIAALVGLWEAAAVEAFYMAGLATNVPQQILRLDELIINAPYFTLGVLLERGQAITGRMGRFSPAIAMIAVLFIGLSLTVAKDLHPAAGRFVTTIAAVSVTQVLVSVARTLFDRPSARVTEVVDASFVIYLFHLPIITGLVWLGQSVALPTPLKALAVMVLTLLLSYAAWIGISRSRVLKMAFDGIRLPRRSPTPAQ